MKVLSLLLLRGVYTIARNGNLEVPVYFLQRNRIGMDGEKS
jgi:hypothetical protein